MKRSKRKLFSWILALSITFTTLFGNVNYVSANELTDVAEMMVLQEETAAASETEVLSEETKEDAAETLSEATDGGAEEEQPAESEAAGEEGSEEILLEEEAPEVDAASSATMPVEIKDALSAEDGNLVTVKGVITLIEGKNIYIQDATGAICVRAKENPTDLALGDTIKGKGTKEVSNGLSQLDGTENESGVYFKVTEESEKITLTSVTRTLKDLTNSDIAKYVEIKGLKVTEISGDNVTVTDDEGVTAINIYRGVYPQELKAGDVIDFKGAVGMYNKLQLRNTVESEITISQKEAEEPSEAKKATVKEALEGTDGINYEVTGTVIMADGRTVYVQDSTGGIGVYLTKSNSNIKVGKVYTFTGVRSVYRDDVVQLGSSTSGASGKSKGKTADPVVVKKDKISDITKADVYSYISMEGLTVEKESGNYYLKDSNGGRIQLYNPKLEKADGSKIDLTAGSVISITAAVGYYNSVQLRNSSGDEITVTYQAEAAPDITLDKSKKVVIYNLGSEGVLAGSDGNTSKPNVNHATGELKDGKVLAGNGAAVFSIETNGAYYRFYNESYGYLYSNGTGSNAGYITKTDLEAQTDKQLVDWEVEEAKANGVKGSYYLKSRSANYNGKPQYLEFYDESYKTYSLNTKQAEIFAFNFYEISNPAADLTGDVVNAPKVVRESKEDAYLGVEYEFSYSYDVPFGVKEMKVTLGEETEGLEAAEELGIYSVVIPKEKVTGDELIFHFTGKDNKDKEFTTEIKVPVLDLPIIETVSPEPGAQLAEEKRPEITATAINVGENPKVVMSVNKKEVEAVYENGKVSYTPQANLEDGRVTVNVTITRADDEEKFATKSWSFFVGEQTERLYFGQMHAHTAEYSDGSGTLDEALDYIADLPDSANVDFVAFTDHSNYFDNQGTANPEDALYDMSKASEYAQIKWQTYREKIRAFNEESSVVALPGFEMTWSGGPGHINTFNTPGIVSRNNATLNNKTDYAGMKAYYALLSREEGKDSISQFNHPGDTFGTFGDFAFWDAVIDQRMRMVEVGNGEGAIGSGGYFPSYEYYIMALDKGWHVAPTNNQDNHKGRWGNANEARDVILTEDFTENGIYQAFRDLRVYSTEDKNLEIYYTLNGEKLGSTIKEIPSQLNLNVTVNDPDGSDKIQKVEVLVNSGKVIHTWSDSAQLAKGELNVTLKPEYSYYLIRVTQEDGDLAITAPVWVGEHIKLGISSFVSNTDIPVTGEELTLAVSFFNGQTEAAKIKSITYTVNGSQVIGRDTKVKDLPASGTAEAEFKHTFSKAKVEKVTATAVVEMNKKTFTFMAEISLDIQESTQLSYIGIDASHYNEYVAGNYKDSMGNFTKLAIPYSLRTKELATGEELIAACNNEKYKAIILTAPSRRLTASHTDPRKYTEEELNALKAFHDRGGVVILAGWSDHYEEPSKVSNNTGIPFDHMAETQNAILEKLGSSLRIADDATYDNDHNGGQEYRLYFNTYGESFLTDGVVIDKENLFSDMHTQQFSHYGGASIYAVDENGAAADTLPATVKPVVFAHASTYSVDVDADGAANGLGGKDVPKYEAASGDKRLMIMAVEELENKGAIIVSGAAFMSDFEVKAELDNSSQMNYSNYKICENIVESLNPMTITKISEVHAQKEEGIKYAVEGYVTSNASGYDKDTAFFDCIYLQDETGGINCFPVAGNYKIGDKLRIVGTTSSYQGERQLAVTSVKVLETAETEGQKVIPKEITAAELNSLSVLGQLVKISGKIVDIQKENGLIQTIMVEDSKGEVARVFIDGYIKAEEEVVGAQLGTQITVTGLASYDNTFKAPKGPFPRIRIKDRADVVCGQVIAGETQNNLWIKNAVADLSYDGTKKVPSFEIYFGDRLLVEKTDYTVTYKNNTNAFEFGESLSAGAAKAEDISIIGKEGSIEKITVLTADAKKAPQAVVTLKGDYKGTYTFYYEIAKVQLSDASVDVEDLTVAYTGKKQTPAPAVTWNGKKLTNKDFEVKEYVEKSTDKAAFVGDADARTVYDLTLVGKGNFAGEKEIKFTIGQKGKDGVEEVPVSALSVSKVVNLVWAEEEEARQQKNFEVKYKKDVPEFNAEEPEKGEYTVSYKNNGVVGTATMVITGTGLDTDGDRLAYIGTRSVTFKITGTDITKAKVDGIEKKYVYTGSAIKPAEEENVKVYIPATKTAEEVKLDKDIHFTVEYQKNVDKGTATVLFVGNPAKGYTGTKKVTFQITVDSINGTEENRKFHVEIVDPAKEEKEGIVQMPFTKGGVKPEVRVTDTKTNKVLIPGTDYTVSYKNNGKLAGTADVKKAPAAVINGKGNYSGKQEVYFEIIAKDLSKDINKDDVKIETKDLAVSTKAGGWKSSIKVTDANGAALNAKDANINAAEYRIVELPANLDELANKDQLAEWKDSGTNLNVKEIKTTLPAGTKVEITVTMAEGGTYTGKVTAAYRILKTGYDISKAAITIGNQVYTGKEVVITENEQFTKSELKNGKEVLELYIEDTDENTANIEVVPGSYVSNVKKGTAKVTLRGREGTDFGGTKTVTFKIGERSISYWWAEVVEELKEIF